MLDERPASHAPAPLWAVLAFTFLNSLGSAVIYSGVFFITKSAYGFSETANLALGLLYGLAYIPAALAVGPLLRILARRGIPPRAVLAAMMLLMASLCFVPILARAWPSSIPIWLVVALYSALSGGMWPIVESYVSGGRTDHALRSAAGKFNVTWSSAVVVALLAMSPLIEHFPLAVVAALGLVHILTSSLLLAFPAAPAAHAHPQATIASSPHHSSLVAHRSLYAQLLAFMRILLPTAFLALSALSPYLPVTVDRLHLAPKLETAFAATCYAARVLTFLVLERTHRWHGSWAVPIAGIFAVIAGFAAVVLAPIALAGAPALAATLAGLAIFGVGVGIIYCAAFYYAMEVGSAQVDAGGMHETLIGIGYTAGPLCGLVAAGLPSLHLITGAAVEPAKVILVSALILASSAVALLLAKRVHA